MYMKTITTTNARKQFAKIIDTVKETGDVFAIGRRSKPDVLLIKFPIEYSSEVNDITNVNTYSESFSFLDEEPELYSVDDLQKRYV